MPTCTYTYIQKNRAITAFTEPMKGTIPVVAGVGPVVAGVGPVVAGVGPVLTNDISSEYFYVNILYALLCFRHFYFSVNFNCLACSEIFVKNQNTMPMLFNSVKRA